MIRSVWFRVLFSSVLFFSLARPAFAVSLSNPVNYYGEDFYKEVASGTRDKDLILLLRKILSSQHQRNRSGMDSIVNACDPAAQGCYQHKSLGYSAARKVLMGQLHLKQVGGQYVIRDVYCERDFTSANSAGIGPGKIPSDSLLNTEHTWPQSRFNGRLSKDMQKSDLHHLFPADSQMNGVRGNFKFGDVAVADKALKCPTVKFGHPSGSAENIFEAPLAHKGNVARALFYFSVRYQLPIDEREEATLRTWNRLDPVDQFERDRNDAIQKIQGNRNPFVDHPELADAIADF